MGSLLLFFQLHPSGKQDHITSKIIQGRPGVDVEGNPCKLDPLVDQQNAIYAQAAREGTFNYYRLIPLHTELLSQS